MIKKFSDIKKVRKIYEQDESMETKANLPENISDESEEKEEKSEEKSESGECSPSKLFSKLFESREMAHIYHLQVNGEEGSYAAHMALGSFYDGVLELVDELIETYQGQHGLIEGYDIIDTKDTRSKDKIEYFTELADFIKSERKCISVEDTHLHNIVDEVVALVYKTLYKLKFNK